MLNIGDKIVCVHPMEELTYGKTYDIIHVRKLITIEDICIIADDGIKWWFGQIGHTECWTKWFVTELEWKRNSILNIIGI
jgi:hypothetical protein